MSVKVAMCTCAEPREDKLSKSKYYSRKLDVGSQLLRFNVTS